MEFEFTWIDPSLVVSRTSGLASAEGFSALYEQLVSQPEFRPGVKVLSDHTKLDISALTAADIEKIADSRVLFIGSIGVSSAVVVGPHSPTKYGLARMFEAFSDGENDARVGVFETFDDAMAWLQADDASSGK